MLEKLFIVSFNIKSDSLIKSVNNIEINSDKRRRLANYINEISPLCLGLQEVTDNTLSYLKPLLLDYEIIGKNRFDKEHLFNEQTSILINRKFASLVESETIWLSSTPFNASQFKTSIFPRTCTMAHIKLTNSSKEIRIFNIHLDFLLSYARMRQIEILLRYISMLQESNPLPFIIMGDFNASYQSNVIQYLTKNKHPYNFQLKNVYDQIQKTSLSNTYHGFITKLSSKKSPIDYIFVSEDLSIMDISIITDNKEVKDLSDHYPITTTLNI